MWPMSWRNAREFLMGRGKVGAWWGARGVGMVEERIPAPPKPAWEGQPQGRGGCSGCVSAASLVPLQGGVGPPGHGQLHPWLFHLAAAGHTVPLAGVFSFFFFPGNW